MLTRDDLLPLLGIGREPAVSLFMPTHESGPKLRKDPIRLKGLLRRAEEAIGDRRQSRQLLAPVHDLIEGDPAEWRHMRRGLAIFTAPDFKRIFKLERRVEERLEIGRRFMIRPLLPCLDEGERVYLLAVEQSAISLYEADAESLRRIEDPNLGMSFDDSLANTELPADVGFHGSGTGSPATGRGTAYFHALGEAPEDYRQKALEHFATAIARTVEPHIRDRRRPLVLMAEPNMLGMLKARLDYPANLVIAVSKSPNRRKVEHLHAEALSAAKPVVEAGRDKLIETFGRLAPRQASDDASTVVQAASEGRIATLLVDPEVELWGRWDSEHHAWKVHAERNADSEDLAESAIQETLKHAGEIRTIPPALLRGAAIAAIFRY